MLILRRLRGLVVLPLVCWLAVQAVMAGAAPRAGPDVRTELRQPMAGTEIATVVLCGSSEPVDAGEPQRNHDGHCWWCLAFGSALVPDAPACARDRTRRPALADLAVPGDLEVVSRGFRLYLGRGPPG